jgi:hypothetical protein
MAKKVIHTCTDRALPPTWEQRAYARSVEENPLNVRRRGAVVRKKLWKPGRILRVRYLDGDPAIQRRLEPFAHQWSQFANIKFVFGNDPDAEIRISFKGTGSWSYIGTDALGIPKNQPTMNFGWLKPDTSDTEYSRVVIHEFGHALGFIHEHQNPVAEIPWDKPKVYAYYAGPPNRWTSQQTDVNLFQRYAAEETNYTAFDKQSIMLYPIPNDFTIGDFEVGWNTKLSDMDKQFIAQIYPGAPKPAVEIPVGGAAVTAAIGVPGEEDVFGFTIAAAGKYQVETLGKNDLVMVLAGPDNPDKVIATDDDSGEGTNARIVQTLQPGRYTVRVRHYSQKKTGEYRIQVKAA